MCQSLEVMSENVQKIFQKIFGQKSLFLNLENIHERMLLTCFTRYLIMVDNVPSLIPTEFPNLKTLFIPPNCTVKLQPLDCSIFGTIKNQYNSWLMRETISIGPENITLEMAVTSLACIFRRLDVRSINHGFKMTGLSLFQSEPTTRVFLE